ncbi:MAG: hypothetical protein LBL99_03520 [Holosporaceae bacterium]|jgi:hypothetical protein|nr:hypothetical protein [Holosporaceae bacterium]
MKYFHSIYCILALCITCLCEGMTPALERPSPISREQAHDVYVALTTEVQKQVARSGNSMLTNTFLQALYPMKTSCPSYMGAPAVGSSLENEESAESFQDFAIEAYLSANTEAVSSFEMTYSFLKFTSPDFIAAKAIYALRGNYLMSDSKPSDLVISLGVQTSSTALVSVWFNTLYPNTTVRELAAFYQKAKQQEDMMRQGQMSGEAEQPNRVVSNYFATIFREKFPNDRLDG